jgi:hypothetical protein
MTYGATLARIRGEYLEMPGLRLTLSQTQRLCGVERSLCQLVLDALVDAGFLRIVGNGLYARVTDGAHHPRSHPAKADLRDTRTDRAS